ncbi:MAG: FAD binding domain-containing protein [Myxococcaceae bacterium]|nr:FAD binding domain-containing protein [Myxococcaceae bacterium]
MLTLPPFQYHRPTSVAEAVALLGEHGGKAKLIAGGTDLVPNMKHRLHTPEHVIGLRDVAELHRVGSRDGALTIGAMVTLADLARDERVSAIFPSLTKAASQIAGPQLREMGTVGGNLALDTRCVYYNQTYFWRKALGYCLKKDGTVCHVVKGGQKCVAAASNDTAPVLIALGATVRLVSPRGAREVPLDQFYVADGVKNTVLEPDELLTEVRVLLPQGRLVNGYQKLRIRASIDYPSLTVAVAAWLEKDGSAQWIRMVLSALGSRPHPVKRIEHLFGKPIDAAAIEELGQAAFKQCHPLTNINVDPGWRRQMIPVFVRRAWAQALAIRS